jgi:hypothetical protein
MVVDNRQEPQLLATSGAVVDEVEAPSLVDGRGSHGIFPALWALLAALTLLHLQSGLLVYPKDPLVIVVHSIAFQEHLQAAIAPSTALMRLLTELCLQFHIRPLAALVVVAALVHPPVSLFDNQGGCPGGNSATVQYWIHFSPERSKCHRNPFFPGWGGVDGQIDCGRLPGPGCPCPDQ